MLVTVLRIDQELQVLIPPLTAEEYRLLEESILSEGCRDALVIWGDTIVDGHNRYKICTRHGIEFSVIEKSFTDKEQARDWIDMNQLGRRNLTPDQTSYLRGRRYSRAEKKPGSRNDLTSGHFVPRLSVANMLAKEHGVNEKTIKRDGMFYKEVEKLKEKHPGGANEIINGSKRAKVVMKDIRKEEIHEERQKIAESAKTINNTDRWNIYHADIKTWQTDKKYDFVITDPPYPREFLPLYEVLAQRSAEWLKPGGLLIVMCGQSYLNRIYETISLHMDYYWTACYHTPGQPTPIRQVNVNTTWKPLLIFTGKNQDYRGKIFGDVFKSDGNDKDFHRWGQSISGMSDVIKKICIPGQHILDPFCGAGTTGVAAIKNRCLFDGIDIDQESVNISRGRLNDTTAE